MLFAAVPRNREGKPVLNPYGRRAVLEGHDARCTPKGGPRGSLTPAPSRPGHRVGRLPWPAYLFGGDDTAIDGSRPPAMETASGAGSTMRRNTTLRGLLRGTFSRKSMEGLSSEQEQAEDQRFYLAQKRDASKFTMVRARVASTRPQTPAWGHALTDGFGVRGPDAPAAANSSSGPRTITASSWRGPRCWRWQKSPRYGGRAGRGVARTRRRQPAPAADRRGWCANVCVQRPGRIARSADSRPT